MMTPLEFDARLGVTRPSPKRAILSLFLILTVAAAAVAWNFYQ